MSDSILDREFPPGMVAIPTTDRIWEVPFAADLQSQATAGGGCP
jgi:hypothetical protein